METVFDHNLTDAEMVYLFDMLEEAQKHRSKPRNARLQDEELHYLAMLMWRRGESDAAEGYADNILNPAYQSSTRLLMAGED